MIKEDPKLVALILTLDGFLRWAEGKRLRPQDFKQEGG